MPIGTSKVGALGGLVPGGTETFNASGTFCVPPGVKLVSIDGTGSPGNPGTTGSPGNSGNPGNGSAGGGGGGGSQPSPTGWATSSTDPGQRGSPAASPTLINSGVFGYTISNNPSYRLCGGNAGNSAGLPSPGGGNAGGAGASGVAGNAGSSGSAGSAGNAGQASSGLCYTFCGGAGGNAGAAGNAGTAGAGATGGSGGNGAPGSTNSVGNGGAGGQFGGSGGVGAAGVLYTNPSQAFFGAGGGGGGGAGSVNSGGNASTLTRVRCPSNQRACQMNPIYNVGKFGGQGGIGNAFAVVNPTQTWAIGYGGPGGSLVSPPAGAGPNDSSNYSYSPFPFSPFNSPLNRFGAKPVSICRIGQGFCATPNQFSVGNLIRCSNSPGAYYVNAPVCHKANVARGGSGGGSGTRKFGNTNFTPDALLNMFGGGGGGGGGGRGVTGGAGGNGGAGGCGAAASPIAYNCVSVTPGSSYPIVVNACGQVTISWNPQ